MNDELDEIAGLIAAVAMAGVALAAPRLPATAAIVPVPPGQKAYVALPDNNEVAVVATRTHQVLAYVPGILRPHDLVASADGREGAVPLWDPYSAATCAPASRLDSPRRFCFTVTPAKRS